MNGNAWWLKLGQGHLGGQSCKANWDIILHHTIRFILLYFYTYNEALALQIHLDSSKQNPHHSFSANLKIIRKNKKCHQLIMESEGIIFCQRFPQLNWFSGFVLTRNHFVYFEQEAIITQHWFASILASHSDRTTLCCDVFCLLVYIGSHKYNPTPLQTCQIIDLTFVWDTSFYIFKQTSQKIHHQKTRWNNI